MKIIDKTSSRIVLLIAISALSFIIWIAGFETVYTRILIGTTNIGLSVIKPSTHLELEKANNKYQFRVRTVIDGRKASFPQEVGSLLQPFVIVLSWQIFLFMVLKRRDATKSFIINSMIFIFIQTFFLINLTGFHTSALQKFMYELLKDSFYVIAIALIIKDNMLYPVFQNVVDTSPNSVVK